MPGLPRVAKISAYCAPLGRCRKNANTSAARRPRLSRWATGVPVSRNVTRASMSAVRSCCRATAPRWSITGLSECLYPARVLGRTSRRLSSQLVRYSASVVRSRLTNVPAATSVVIRRYSRPASASVGKVRSHPVALQSTGIPDQAQAVALPRTPRWPTCLPCNRRYPTWGRLDCFVLSQITLAYGSPTPELTTNKYQTVSGTPFGQAASPSRIEAPTLRRER